jgi:hypothetical protein
VFPGERGEVLEVEAVVELEAGLAGEGDLEEDFGGLSGRGGDGDGVADADWAGRICQLFVVLFRVFGGGVMGEI